MDDGALHAVSKRMSFFPVGVKRVDGEFCRGDVVAITSLQDLVIGAGVSNFSSKDLRRVMGMRSSEIASKIEIAPNRVMDNDLIVAGKRFTRLQELPRSDVDSSGASVSNT